MRKRVNIYPRGPITNVNPPIRVSVKGVTKDVQDIRKCIIAGAKVEELTSNGPVLLNLNNYDRDNGGDPNPVAVRIENALPPIPKDDTTRKTAEELLAERKAKEAEEAAKNPMQAVEAPKAEPELETMNVDEVLETSDTVEIKEDEPVKVETPDVTLSAEVLDAKDKPVEAPKEEVKAEPKPVEQQKSSNQQNNHKKYNTYGGNKHNNSKK